MQGPGQFETRAKSTNKKVNGGRAAENAGQESRPLRGVKNGFLTKDRHSLARGYLRNARVAKKDKKPKEAEGENPEVAEGAEGEAPAKKKLPLKMLIIAGAAAVVVLGGGGTAAFMFLSPKPDAAAEKGDHAKDKKKDKKKDEKKEGKEGEKGAAVVREGPDGVVFYTLPDVVVNMQTADGRPTFLKLKLTLELPDESLVEELDPNMPRLQDMFQTFLRELRPEDLSGSQGSYQLRMEILRRVNLVIAPSKANAVLIEEMLIN
jgi:flagellar FliL protein